MDELLYYSQVIIYASISNFATTSYQRNYDVTGYAVNQLELDSSAKFDDKTGDDWGTDCGLIEEVVSSGGDIIDKSEEEEEIHLQNIKTMEV